MSDKTNIEKIFRDKLLNAEVMPPTDVKSSIDNALNFPGKGPKSKGLYIVGVVLLLISFSVALLLMNSSEKEFENNMANNNGNTKLESQFISNENHGTATVSQAKSNTENSQEKASQLSDNTLKENVSVEYTDENNVKSIDKTSNKSNNNFAESSASLDANKRKFEPEQETNTGTKERTTKTDFTKPNVSKNNKADAKQFSEDDSTVTSNKKTTKDNNQEKNKNSSPTVEQGEESSVETADSEKASETKVNKTTPEVKNKEEEEKELETIKKEEKEENSKEENEEKAEEESNEKSSSSPAAKKASKVFSPSFAAGVNANLGQFNPSSVDNSGANSSTTLGIKNMEFSVEAYGLLKVFDVYNLQAGLKQSFNKVSYEEDSTIIIFEQTIDTTYLFDTTGAIIDTAYMNVIDSSSQTISEMYSSKLSSFSIPLSVGRTFTLNPNGNENWKLTSNIGVIFNFNSLSTEQNIPNLEFNKFTMSFSLRNTLSYSISNFDIILPIQLYYTPKARIRYQDTRIDPKSSFSLGLGIQYNF